MGVNINFSVFEIYDPENANDVKIKHILVFHQKMFTSQIYNIKEMHKSYRNFRFQVEIHYCLFLKCIL